LTYDQINEVFDLMGDIDGINDQTGEGTSYFPSREEVIRELEVEPSVPGRPEEPEEPEDPDEEEEQNQSDASGGACFVATAAYGDRLHPDVVDLRRFRDAHLCKSVAGRAFIRFYWIVGPVMARYTKPGDMHAKIARYGLARLVSVLRKAGRC